MIGYPYLINGLRIIQDLKLNNMNLKEHIRKALKEYYTPEKEDYSDIEKVINNLIPNNFPWFKKIKIDKISNAVLSNTLTIYGELTVDEEWGGNQWRRYYDYKPFPSNDGWEDEPFPSNDGWEDEDPIRLGDIIGKDDLNDLNNEIEIIVSSVGNYTHIDNMRLGQLKLHFV